MVNAKINNIPVSVPEGTTILEAAKSIGIDIPTLCFLKDLNEIAACRICVVEIEGEFGLIPACDNVVTEGMVISTNSPRVREARRVNLRLLLSQHDVQCTECVRSGNCKLQQLSNDYNILGEHYKKELVDLPIDYTTPFIRLDNRCVKCMRCIQVCEKVQTMNIWDLVGTGSRTNIAVSPKKATKLALSDCTFCGQCVTHCPTGALQERDDTSKVFDAIADPKKTVVVQVAPAVRVAWAEYFGMNPEEGTAKRMCTALKALGFDYVFDTNFAADLTIMEEGSEFIERFTHKDHYQWPMFTSCCPGWVRFVKGQFPKYQKNLSTAKSPQGMFGAIAKSFFAERIGVDPHDMVVVSVMPCTAKKAEVKIPNLNDACGDPDVDISITTREMVRMFRTFQLNPKLMPETEFDSPLGEGTGAAVIFGATGGVMDAALRSAYFLVTGSNPPADAFTDVRGIKGWKEATFNVPGAGDVRVAVVSGLGNTRAIMEAIDKGEVEYDFVEIMACPGGCAGGGGQTIHDGVEMAEYRGDALWNIDKNMKVRFSHENSQVGDLYQLFLEKPLGHKSHHLLHTDITEWDIVDCITR